MGFHLKVQIAFTKSLETIYTFAHPHKMFCFDFLEHNNILYQSITLL